MNRRYLTPTEKTQHLASWHRLRTNGKDTDPEVYALTDRLNAIEGVCTIQSCSGHPGERHADLLVAAHAYLWLRLSEPMTEQLLEYASDLIREHLAIEQVQLVFGPPEGEIVEIGFEGLNVSPEAFAEASDIIVAFFRRLESLVGAPEVK